ncbi:MAG: GLUG motif-containing protein, partial [Planctomycetota bacterium]
MLDFSKSFDLPGILLFALLTISFSALPAHAKYGGGTGEPNDPYLIYDANQMNAIGADSNDWDKCFLLCADIDLSDFTGTTFNIIGYSGHWTLPNKIPFTGVFDGNGHTISNFTYTSTEGYHVGLFGYVGNSGAKAKIKDLGLIDPNVDVATGERLGSLVGRLDYGTITNCYVQGGSVSGNYQVGGLVGCNDMSTISNCYSTTSVSGEWFVGGLVGHNLHGTISNCYSTGSVEGYSYVGGLVGWHNRGTISNCYSTGGIEGYSYVGGLVGNNDGTITNSYSEGVVSGDYHVGGLAGYNNKIISNCYSTASVSGVKNVGGLIGWNDSTITNSYSTGSVSGNERVGGLVGYGGVAVNSFWDIETSGQATSAGGWGKTTHQMQDLNTFLYWGACGNEGVWTINDSNDYPRFAWENMPGEPITPPSYGGGSGEPNDPYLIYTAEQLNTIGLITCHWDRHFLLCADVDLNSVPGTSFNIIGNYKNRFTGVFDGSSHKISNFTYTSTGRDYIGMFGYVDSGEIRDLGLSNTEIDAGTGDYVGSLVGRFRDGTIANCYADGGSVYGHVSVGGLVGYNYGTITNSYSTCSVSGDWNLGGLVGRNRYGTITNSYATGSVIGYRDVGGLVGGNQGTIINCYSTASVSGDERVGGLVGSGGTVIHSYWDTETSGQTTSARGTGKTTAQMRKASTFIGWGACGNEQIWTISDGTDYPRLAWENMPGTPIEGQLSDFLYGAGREHDPYLIYTTEQLNMIGLFTCEWDRHFLLCADIDLSVFSGTSYNIIGTDKEHPFTGVFDGNDHTISNFTYDSNDRSYIGLFGYVNDTNAEIKNLGLIDPNVDAATGGNIGSLVGRLQNGNTSNCYGEGGSVYGRSTVGGLVGYSNGDIRDCYAIGSVFGNNVVGGLVGYNENSIVD